MKTIKNRKGFTLVELLVVIGIIAALAGFAIANLGSAEKAVRTVSVKSDLKQNIQSMKIVLMDNDDENRVGSPATFSRMLQYVQDDAFIESDALVMFPFSPKNYAGVPYRTATYGTRETVFELAQKSTFISLGNGDTSETMKDLIKDAGKNEASLANKSGDGVYEDMGLVHSPGNTGYMIQRSFYGGVLSFISMFNVSHAITTSSGRVYVKQYNYYEVSGGTKSGLSSSYSRWQLIGSASNGSFTQYVP